MGKESSKASLSISLIGRTFYAFVGVTQNDALSKKTEGALKNIFKRGVYLFLDYWLTAIEAVLSVYIFKNLPLDGAMLFVGVFISIWFFEIVCALGFIAYWKIGGVDITLSEDWRRAVDVLSESSKSTGSFIYWTKIIKAIIWDGPEEIIIFCHKELNSSFKVTLVLFGVTAFQAVFWSGAFLGFYESFIWVWEHIMFLL